MIELKNLKEYVINCTIAGKSKKRYEDIDCGTLHNIEYDENTNTFYGTLTLIVLAESEDKAIKSAENTVDSMFNYSPSVNIGELKDCRLVSYDEHPCEINKTGDVFRCSDSYPFESFKVSNIEWDADRNVKSELPSEIDIPLDMIDLSECEDYEALDDMISNYITEQTGFCHLGFALEHNNELEELFNDYE